RDRVISGLAPYQINRRGLSRSFQVTNVFANMSVWENLRCAVLWSTGQRYAFWKNIDSLPEVRDRTSQILADINLSARRDVPAGLLTYAEQRALEIGITVAGGGEVVSLLGRNGVGRSTTVKAIMGEVPPQGSIKFKGGDIAGLPSYRIAHLGLGYVPEHRDIFPGLTVRQNLMLGIKDTRRAGKWRLEDMLKMFPNLAARADTPAGVLSGGEKQMLTVCR